VTKSERDLCSSPKRTSCAVPLEFQGPIPDSTKSLGVGARWKRLVGLSYSYGTPLACGLLVSGSLMTGLPTRLSSSGVQLFP